MKRFVSLLTAVLIFCSAFTLSATDYVISEEGTLCFSDVMAEVWYTDAIAFAYVNEIMRGNPDNTFLPFGNTTREQMITVLANVSGEDVTGYPACSFTDVDQSSWYAPFVNWASAKGYTSGIGDNLFGVGKALSRSEAVTLLYNFAAPTEEASADLTVFGDHEAVPDWATAAFSWAVGSSLVKGDNGNLKPGDSIKRAELAVIMKGFVENIIYSHCEHNYSEQTCLSPAICKNCGLVRGIAKGHKYLPTTCTSLSECVNCGMHIEAEGHSFAPASCTLPMTCTTCGATHGSALGHTTEKGICDRCHEPVFSNKYEQFAYYMENTAMTDKGIKFLFAEVTHKDGARSDQYIKYDPSNGSGTFEIYYSFAESDVTMVTVIDFSGIAGGYRAVSSYYVDGDKKYDGIAYLVPSTFSAETPINMTTYNGEKSDRDAFEKLFRYTLVFCLDGTDKLLSEFADMTAADFGFTAFK